MKFITTIFILLVLGCGKQTEDSSDAPSLKEKGAVEVLRQESVQNLFLSIENEDERIGLLNCMTNLIARDAQLNESNGEIGYCVRRDIITELDINVLSSLRKGGCEEILKQYATMNYKNTSTYRPCCSSYNVHFEGGEVNQINTESYFSCY